MSEINGMTAVDLDGTDHRLPLYARLRDVLTGRIISGEWTPGEPIPSETVLASLYGVSVGTMRKALQQLVDEGLLERRHGSGTFVRRAKLDQSLFRFFRYSDRKGVPTARVLSRNKTTASAAPELALALGPKEPVIRIERLRFWSDEPFLLENIVLPHRLFAPLMALGLNELGPLLYPLYEKVCGQIVARAEEVLTIAQADAATAQALDCEPGAPIVAIERLARGHDGLPLEWRRSLGRADRFSYRVDIR